MIEIEIEIEIERRTESNSPEGTARCDNYEKGRNQKGGSFVLYNGWGRVSRILITHCTISVRTLSSHAFRTALQRAAT